MNKDKLNILAIGRNAEILAVVHRLINGHEGWTAASAQTDEEAIALLSKGAYDIILLCTGITKEEEVQWRERLLSVQPQPILLRHFGGGSGLLENEILSALL